MSLPKDVGYGLDGFHRQEVYNEAQSVARYILEILLTRPGNYPGLPHIGLNIRQLLYNNLENFNSQLLKEQIYNQCNLLMPSIVGEDIYVGVVVYAGREYLLIRIPALIESSTKVINYAFYQDELRELKFNFEIQDE